VSQAHRLVTINMRQKSALSIGAAQRSSITIVSGTRPGNPVSWITGCVVVRLRSSQNPPWAGQLLLFSCLRADECSVSSADARPLATGSRGPERPGAQAVAISLGTVRSGARYDGGGAVRGGRTRPCTGRSGGREHRDLGHCWQRGPSRFGPTPQPGRNDSPGRQTSRSNP
jgi:hypothetical protein